MAKRGETWSEEETSALIAIWGNEEIQRKLSNTHKNSEIYKKISKNLKTVHGFGRDHVQCRNKIKQLRGVYKKHKDSHSTSGAGRKKTPKFFDDMDNFLNDKPDATGVANAIDTSDTVTVNETDNESDVSMDIERDLIQKYGEGSVFEKTCPDCGYVVELQSSGVHISDNGCTKVYCEDDEFNCPKCSYTDKESGEIDEPKSKPKVKGGEKSKKETAVERAIGKFTEYQKESDQAFLHHMTEQARVEADLRSQELKAFTDSMALLAGAIAGNRANPIQAQERVYSDNYQTRITDDGKTYYTF